MSSKVSLVKSLDSYDGVFAALKPLEKEISAKIKRSKKPIIKVNFVSTYRELAATPVEAVRATLDFLKPLYNRWQDSLPSEYQRRFQTSPYGEEDNKSGQPLPALENLKKKDPAFSKRKVYKDEILIVEGATLGETPEGFKNFGYLPLEEEYEVKLFDLNYDQASPVTLHDRDGQPFNLPLVNTVKNSDFIISLCRPKTHDAVVVTLSLKNLVVGSLLNRSRIHQGKMIHQNLADLAKVIKPSLAVIDGTIGMEGEGPTSGTEIKSGWVAAGLDFLAVDSLGAYLMGFELDNIGYLKLCHEESLGNAYPNKVKVIGEKPEDLRKIFQPHSTYSSQIRWR